LMATLILEAGLPASMLESEIEAMAIAARKAGVCIVGGDTKVVEHGKADGMYVSTFGIGLVDERVTIDAASIRPGDRILLSGPIGAHGITILLARGELDLQADLLSDTRPVWPLVSALLERCAADVRWMRDPTRGGVATSLNELVRGAAYGIALYEECVPMHDAVRGACELLGLDPLHIANEGQFLAVVAAEHADEALAAVRAVPGGEEAVLIGEVRAQPKQRVVGINGYGGTRVIDMLVGDPLPRIC
jgi:hydrogenase expression/formation protein HypE